MQASDVGRLGIPLPPVAAEKPRSAKQRLHPLVRRRADRPYWNRVPADEFAHLSHPRVVHEEEQERWRDVQNHLRHIRLVAELDFLLDLRPLELRPLFSGVLDDAPREEFGLALLAEYGEGQPGLVLAHLSPLPQNR